MALTYAEFIADIAGMTVTGVKQKLSAPPTQINTADLPLMFPRLPEGSNETFTFSGEVGLDTVACELAIVVNPAQQATSPINFALAVTLMDALTTQLKAKVVDFTLDRWTIRQDADFIGDTLYWLLIARVEASR
jgi:hypothetical protein